MAKKISPAKKAKKTPVKKIAAKKKVTKKSKPKKAIKTLSKVKTINKVKKKGEDLMCFLTTACVDYYHLNDNCIELNKLRDFRDKYLLTNARGKKLVEEYYQLSPKIVSAVNASENKTSRYAYIYGEIKKACCEIDSGRLKTAEKVYVNMVNHLRKSYLL